MSLLQSLPATGTEKIRYMSTWMSFGENVAFVRVAGGNICWWPDHCFLMQWKAIAHFR